jgi:hypothetical protein
MRRNTHALISLKSSLLWRLVHEAEVAGKSENGSEAPTNTSRRLQLEAPCAIGYIRPGSVSGDGLFNRH